MKKTEKLKVIPDFSMTEKQININPNDGFDLGLMTNQYVVKIFENIHEEEFISESARFQYGHLNLENKCKNGTLEMGKKKWEKIGKPPFVFLSFEDGKSYGKILITPAPK